MQVSPLAELSLAWATASFRAKHYGFRFPSKTTVSYLLINRGQSSSSTHSMVFFFLHSQYKLKHAFILPKTQTGSPWLSIPGGQAVSGRIACLSDQVSPCPSCARQGAWRQHLSAKWQLRAEGSLASGMWPVHGKQDGLERRGGRDCGLFITVEVPYAQGQPWMGWMVWSKTVNRSFIAANILYYLHQSQTDLVLPQETLSRPSYVRHKMMPLK